MKDPGVRLQLLVGATVPAPAPYAVVDALESVEVQHNDRQRDGFQLAFKVGRRRQAQDFRLLDEGWLDPPNRVSILVLLKGLPEVLINGVVTRHEFVPSYQPGETQLRVTGEDTSVLLDLKERSRSYPNRSDSEIVEEVLRDYPALRGDVTRTSDSPSENQRVPSQRRTDLEYIRELARNNGFVFFTEPTAIPGLSMAYWGPRDRPNLPKQPPLSHDMGSVTNVERIDFRFQALDPVSPQASIIEPLTGRTLAIPAPNLTQGGMAGRPAQPLRTTVLRDTANLDFIQASLRVLAEASSGADAVRGTGELDVMRYGRVLRSRRQVGVRGVGKTHDGYYYVEQVTHRLRRGEYRQSFTLSREGQGCATPTVETAA